MSNNEFVNVIDRYLNCEDEDFSQIYMYGRGGRKTILKLLEKYLKYRPEQKEKVVNIIEHIDDYLKMEMTSENFKKVLIGLSNQFSNYRYMVLATSLLTSTEEEAIIILHKQYLEEKEFNKFLSKFQTRFPNQKREYNYFIELYNNYKIKYNIIEENNNTNYINTSLTNGSKSYQLLKDIFESNLCIEEYCDVKKQSISFINKYLNGIKNKKVKPFIDIIKDRDNKEYLRKIIMITSKLDSMDDFDMIDYYEYTNLRVVDFIQLLKLVDKNNRFNKLIIKLKTICNLPLISKNEQLSCKTIIRGREITLEEKEKIFAYLEQNNLNENLYRVALNRFLNNELNFDKVYTLKK